MISRTVAPPVKKVITLNIPPVEAVDHLYSTPIFAIGDESEELVKIEITFPAGTGEEKKSLLASAVAAMLTEGAGKYTANQISELKDFYGAKIQTGVGKDNATVSVLCLSSKLRDIFPVFAAIVQSPKFPETEFEAYKERARASLKVNLDRVELQARLLFSERFFGYSKYAENYAPDHFDQLSLQDLNDFYQSNYALADAKIFVSGKGVNDAILLLKEYFADREKSFFEITSENPNPVGGIGFRPKENALQSAIRLGIESLSRNAKEYPAFSLTNTILGGYFGSRLMQNIREDKGYTYGIGTSINHLKDYSYLIASTQVGAEHTRATLREIKREISKLQNEPVGNEELELVQNYVAGLLLRNMDGTFNQAALIKTMITNGLSGDYYNRFLNGIYSVTPDQIMDIAQKHLGFEKFTGAIAGPGYDDNVDQFLSSK